ncbi:MULTISPECIES: hypothetical protein [unclassified Bradyrhizobium]|uniref:hypothetical protein n=1 Tax=unclassified Bradyrhizobium TaxID=2631580 RepID=UPI0029161A0A|nr:MULTISPECIES: hypothetical protein [unclassified Bradyrhizobium]
MRAVSLRRNADILETFKAGGLVLTFKEPINVVGSVPGASTMWVTLFASAEAFWRLKEWYPNRSFKKEKEASKTDEGAEADVGASGATSEPE